MGKTHSKVERTLGLRFPEGEHFLGLENVRYCSIALSTTAGQQRVFHK